jgi:hypothetical protein
LPLKILGRFSPGILKQLTKRVIPATHQRSYCRTSAHSFAQTEGPNPMAKETKETGERLVIGIDYGTTYTGTREALRAEFYATRIY